MARIVPATEEWIAKAAEIIAGGGLVAFPTETVYGLGANALNAEAVRKIFAAKGRPVNNPLIVHVADVGQLSEIAFIENAFVEPLAAAFWPGPLTIVLPKREQVPEIVTAGGATVAARIPNHPVALQLLRKAAVPVAAPSANRSESISPTRAEHVAESLGDAVHLILDGGPCSVGLESTVLNLCAEPPIILRPGAVTPEQIERAIGVRPNISAMPSDSLTILKSPGQMRRHYAPAKPLLICNDFASEAADLRTKVGLIYREGTVDTSNLPPNSTKRALPVDPQGYARGFYAVLRELDGDPAVETILVQAVPDTEEWLAVRDRLNRAAASKEKAD